MSAPARDGVAVLPNRKERRHWDRYVKDAQDVCSEVELSDGTVITIYVPSADSLGELNRAELENDPGTAIWKQMAVLMGADNAELFRADGAGEAPVTALMKLLNDILADLGLSTDPGNAPRP